MIPSCLKRAHTNQQTFHKKVASVINSPAKCTRRYIRNIDVVHPGHSYIEPPQKKAAKSQTQGPKTQETYSKHISSKQRNWNKTIQNARQLQKSKAICLNKYGDIKQPSTANDKRTTRDAPIKKTNWTKQIFTTLLQPIAIIMHTLPTHTTMVNPQPR